MVTLRFSASDGKSLVLVPVGEHRDYGCLVLEERDRHLTLGGNDYASIRKRMLLSLRSPNVHKDVSTKGVFPEGVVPEGIVSDGEIETFYIVNLMGPHAILYGFITRESAGSSAIKWVDILWQQAKNSKETGHFIMRATEADIQSWIKILEETPELIQ